jgi:uncharacterized protein YegL
MKSKTFCKFCVIGVLILMCIPVGVIAQNSQQSMYRNFQKLVLYHAASANEYYLAVIATDDKTRIANFDTMNVHIKLEMMEGESRFIDNEDLKIICLGTMYNEVIGRENTLFRFNLIIDNSGSIDQQSLGYVQHTLKRFIELVPLVFEAQVIRFSQNIQLKTPFTKDKNALIDAITRSLPQGATALFDAIDLGVQELKTKKDEIPLRFAVVLTDGKNNASVNNPDPVAFKNKITNECRQYYIPLFIVGVTDSVDSQLLNQLAKYGFYRHIKKFPDIDQAFRKILQVIKDTYIFKIPAVGNFQNIKTLYIVQRTPGGNIQTIQDINVH